MASCRVCHRFLVKALGIATFFVVASLYKWTLGDGIVELKLNQRSLALSYRGMAQRSILESLEHATEVAGSSITDCSEVASQPPSLQCQLARVYCTQGSGRSMVNYLILHYCGMGGQGWISVPVLVGVLILAFYVLAETAENYFSPVVQKTVEVLGMTPSMGGVTLLALGNGAPDIFASLAAIQGDNSRIGFSAILSAGTFVSGFVVGLVALASAPFSVQPMPFVRDVSFYLGAVCLLFMVYLNGEIVFWQAIGMVSFYVLFVVVVICTNQKRLDPVDRITFGSDATILGDSGSMQKIIAEDKRVLGVLGNVQDVTEDQVSNGAVTLVVSSPQSGATGPVNKDILSRCQEMLTGICRRLEGHSQIEEVMMLLHMPACVLLKCTIPEIDPSKWSRNYGTVNIMLCPLLILYMFTSLVSLNRHIIFLAPQLRFPIWAIVLLQGFFMGAAYYLAVKRPPASGQYLSLLVAFVMSVFWISVIAGELLECLVTLGIILRLSPALLGLTVLAWGNSVGDLVANVAVARVGQPAMAIAGCFAGPMFNMLVGLGTALCLQTVKEFPVGYHLDQHPGILLAFGFLSLNLLSTLLFVTSSKFQLTRFWGKCLISWYVLFMVLSVIVADIN